MKPKGLLLPTLALACLIFPASALAASPPSISSSFTPSSIGVGDTSTLSFTISNPANNGTLTGIGFTDTLPSGLVVDTPNGVGGTCGGVALSATSGSGTISLTGGTLAQGTSCTVYANVTSNTAQVYSNNTGDVTSNEGGTGTSDTEQLAVVNPPTVTISSPTNHATYAYGQKVVASYSCQDDPNGPGIAQGGCQGDVPSGSAINTTRPGLRSFTVTATSNDGQVTFKTIYYTVAGGNKFSVKNLYSMPDGRIGFDIKVQARGKLDVTEKAVIRGQANQKPVAFGQLSPVVNGDEGFAVYPSSSGKALVSQARSANSSGGHHEQIWVTLTMKFTPPGATARTKTYEVMVSP